MSEPLFGGCDVGSTTGKAVLVRDDTVIASVVVPCLARPEKTAELVPYDALE